MPASGLPRGFGEGLQKLKWLERAMIDDEDAMPIPGQRYEAWAIWNCCQGVFTDSVRCWRIECEEDLPRYGEGAKVVPVTVTVDPADGWHLRHYLEDDSDRLHGRGKFAKAE